MEEKKTNKILQIDKIIPGKLDTPEIKYALKKAEDATKGDRVLKFAQMQASKMNDGPTFDRKEPVPATKLFDNLYYFGNQEVGAFVFDTGDGLLMIDSGFPHMLDSIILPGMKEFGLDPAQVKKMLITHCGPDHRGCAYYFQTHYGTKVYMSQEEFERLPSDEENLRRYENTQKPDFVYDQFDAKQAPEPIASLSEVVKDGDIIKQGNLEVICVGTPRRTNGGGTSYLANVYDNGEKHIFATYGNTNVVGSQIDMLLYRGSLDHYRDYVEKYEADVFISNHPFVDDSVRTMKLLRKRMAGEPNPFVFGHEKVLDLLKVLDLSSAVIRMRRALGLNEAGCGPYVPGVMDLANGSINTTK